MTDTERKAYAWAILGIVGAAYAWALSGCPTLWDWAGKVFPCAS